MGKHTFISLTQFISKKGESKAGLSTYYVKLAHALDVFKQILGRLKEIGVEKKSNSQVKRR